jgi:preprotein translocase subunit SecA
VREILARQGQLSGLSDAELVRMSHSLTYRIRSGTPLNQIVTEGMSLVDEAIFRVRGFRLYPVQWYAGVVLLKGCIAEMATGEGKTLTGVAPTYLQCLMGKGCHVMTANPYLAQRDADELRPIFTLLGKTVGCVHPESTPEERLAAYAADITYGTANEFGFDYLRDALQAVDSAEQSEYPALQATSQDGRVQRGRHFALIDEADSILLDDGRTPLIIALPEPDDERQTALWKWCHAVAATLQPQADFEFEPRTKNARLTRNGCRHVVLQDRPALVASFPLEHLYEQIEVALKARYGFVCDLHYLVNDEGVQIVDESTGRSLDGRRWQAGLHQAIEILEGREPTPEHKAAAKITMQRYLQLYPLVSGMTGTAWTARRELKHLYRLSVKRIPTHRRCLRTGRPTRIFRTLQQKDQAVVAAARQEVDRGRAVLIGTPSIRASERLAELFASEGVASRVLNARQDASEHEIVAEAGQPRGITIATNMAGRGTDIVLADKVREAGGLHVIATEYHSSRRIDRQLVGRAARQGDPGSFQFFVSLEDELFLQLPESRRRRWHQLAARQSSSELSPRIWLGTFQRLQMRLERLHAKERRQSLKAEKRRWKQLKQMGLNPSLDLAEDP